MSTPTLAPVALSLKDAAASVGYSEQTLRRAINWDAGCGWPQLKAKRDPNGTIRVLPADLEAWVRAFDDA